MEDKRLHMLASLNLGPERAQSWGMATRYDLREDDNGWTVYDLWTGKSLSAELPRLGSRRSTQRNSRRG